MGAQPRPVPRAERTRRQVKCRGCGDYTGIPGAGYCDACRPTAHPSLLGDIDIERLAGKNWARCPECDGLAIATKTEPSAVLRHRQRCSQWSDAWQGRQP